MINPTGLASTRPVPDLPGRGDLGGWDCLGDLGNYDTREAITKEISQETGKTKPTNDSLAAWEFAKFWLTPENQAALLLETGHSPATHAAYDHPIGQQCLDKWPDLAVFRKAYEHADKAVGINDFPTMALEYLGMRPIIYRLIMGKLSPQSAVQQMQAKCQSILNDFWAKADQGVFELFPEALHK